MQMQIQGQIMGVKRFNGQIDGKTFDYCRVIVATPLDASQGNALGSSATEYDFGGSANFEQFKSASFPFDAVLNVELVTNGKSQKLKIIGFQPKTQHKG
ncbi:hypothetical protein LVJ85_06490 [Neisseria sp. Dent CA1/247]|uniref:hypothetical protein n=1 Tax=Neisseria sp. Dent CA1/247 TaxID=2912675 RepID=UPI001FCF940B|nr:hypothetical protein [Neisseria sp. Dent CA1/247]UOO78101.1 hypothetical protein LVJ85_06490 [Neisseria sp. Dent CA1/247]